MRARASNSGGGKESEPRSGWFCAESEQIRTCLPTREQGPRCRAALSVFLPPMQYPDCSPFLVPCFGRQVPRAQFWIFVCNLPPSLHSARRQHVQSVHWIETNGVVPPPQSPPPDLKKNSRAQLCRAKGVTLDTKGMAPTRQISPPDAQLRRRSACCLVRSSSPLARALPSTSGAKRSRRKPSARRSRAGIFWPRRTRPIRWPPSSLFCDQGAINALARATISGGEA